ncbi:hypothetical protein B0H19DRAFT_1171445 [Mycena capillaripes]|nr:hypothetical protein B0H19DRAFT_1171445 [Mycena capillaripes]
MEEDPESVSARAESKHVADTHRRAAATYRWRNEEDLREKARVRMAAYRQRLRDEDPDREARKERARASDKKYRAKQANFIAFKQRVRRQNAYIEKHGAQAYRDRCAREDKAAAVAKALEEAAAARPRARTAKAAQAARSCAIAFGEHM